MTNPRLKRVVKLQNKTRERLSERAFVIEGLKLFKEAPISLIEEVYLTEDFYLSYFKKDIDLENKLKGCEHEFVSEEIMRRISDTISPQGLLCVLKQMDDVTELLEAHEDAPFYLIIEDLQDPGNLGTIFRTAEAAGVTGIIMNYGCTDIYNPKTIRGTMGSLFRVPFIYVKKLIPIVKNFKNKGIGVYATCPEGIELYDNCDYRSGTAIIIGSESLGLTDEMKAIATEKMVIPMAGEIESLNAATAASIFMYEVVKQRNRTCRRESIKIN